jgi:hypothetical protein
MLGWRRNVPRGGWRGLLSWWWRWRLTWDGGELWRIGSSLALVPPVRSTEGFVRMGHIDVDMDLEEGVVPREEGALLGVEEARTRTVGYLRCEGGPHLHEFVTSGRGGETKLSLAVEVEFPDEVETRIPTGGALWGSDGGHG